MWDKEVGAPEVGQYVLGQIIGGLARGSEQSLLLCGFLELD